MGLQEQIVTDPGQSLAVLKSIENHMKAIAIATGKANREAKDYQRTLSERRELKQAGTILGRGTGEGGKAVGEIFKGSSEGGMLGRLSIALAGITAGFAAINRANEVALSIAEERLNLEKRARDVGKDIGHAKDSIATKGESAAANRRKLLGAGKQDALDDANDVAGQLGDPSGVEAGVIAAYNKTQSKSQARAAIDVARRVALGGGDFGGAIDEAVKYPVMLGKGADQDRLATMIHHNQTGGNLTQALRNVQGDNILGVQEDVNGIRAKTREAQVDRFRVRGVDMANREFGENSDPENTARQKLADEINEEIERKKQLALAENAVIAGLEDLAAAMGVSAGSLTTQAARAANNAGSLGITGAAPAPASSPGTPRFRFSSSAPGAWVEYQK